MYSGTMIDDLIGSVQKAEAHAQVELREEQTPLQVEMHAAYSYEFTYHSEALLGVA